MNEETYAMATWRCPHCDSHNILGEGAPVPDRHRPVLHITHAPGCPDYIDLENMPAVEYRAEDFGDDV